MTKNIPYKYFKSSLVGVWGLALLCIIATWVGFCVANTAAVVFGAIVDSLLAAMLILLIVLLLLNGRKDYQKRAIIFGALTLAHILFFILVLALRNRMHEGDNGLFALPAIHTILLLGICAVGVYFWIRNKFTFKTEQREDASVAFGGAVDQPENKPVQPEEPKKARDEKTGIVSL